MPSNFAAPPAITAEIIGPRTTDYLDWQLSAAEVERSDDDGVDRIDEMVAPEETISVGRRRLDATHVAARSSPPLSSDSPALGDAGGHAPSDVH